MSAAEIAKAYVGLYVKMPGVQNTIAQSLGAPGVQGAMSQAGTTAGDRMISAMGKTLKVGAVAVGGIIAAGIGTALVKGFQRLDAIDTAAAKLRGLGHDAGAVDTIMANALASVKGTAFGLGDAATVAAQAVAAGIKPGRDLEQVLGTVANTAAAAGTDLGEMGSIFAKAMTQANGVQNDVISQLADRGIPIYQALADQMGVTAGEVFKMASAGKIDFETFAAAATAASGTVASEMGGTWSGAFDNFMAALGRVGEGLLAGLFPQMKDGLQDVTAFLAPFEEGAKQVGETVGAFVADAGPKLVDVLKGIWTAGENVVGWIKDNTTWLGPLVVGVGAAATVYTVWTGAIGLWTVATNVAKAAQLAFNTALKANPIGLIVTAITALVAGLVWFFTETELGKAIWAEFTRFLGEAWTNITGFFTSAWENVIQPVFKAIGDIATWLYENILKPVFDGIGAVVGFVAAAFKLHFDLIVNAFRLVGAIAGWLWTNAVKPVFDAIGAIVTWLWTTIIEPYVNAWGALFTWLWETILSPIFGYISLAVRGLGLVFEWLYINIVKPTWDGISSAISTAWKWIDQNVFTPFKNGIDLVARGFELARAAIEKTWDGIKKAAAVPINFVLETIWNNGLRSFWNGMVDELGLGGTGKDSMRLPRAELVKFASGGVLPGYTPGRDVHMFTSPTGGRLALSGGEAIMRPEFTRLVGGAAGVDALNKAARNGQLPMGDGLGSFAGDVLDNVMKAAQVAWDFISNPAQAIKSHVIDGIIRPMMGDQNLFGKTVGGLAEKTLMGFVDLFKQAAPTGIGSAGMGWEAMWNIVRNQVPGAVMTSNFRSPSANAAVGGVKGSYHTQGRAIDLVPATMATFNAVAKLFPNASELIYTPAGNRQLQNGKPFNGWSPGVKRSHFNHVHLAMANGGVIPSLATPKLYDQGGWLPSGGVAVNQSGKPEPVFTNSQWELLRNGIGGTPSELVVVDADGALIGRMRVEAQRATSEAFPSPQAVHSEVGHRR